MVKDNKIHWVVGYVQERLKGFVEIPNKVIEKYDILYLMKSLEYGLWLERVIKENQILNDLDWKVVHLNLTQKQKEEWLKKVREKIEFIRLILRNKCPIRRINMTKKETQLHCTNCNKETGMKNIYLYGPHGYEVLCILCDKCNAKKDTINFGKLYIEKAL